MSFAPALSPSPAAGRRRRSGRAAALAIGVGLHVILGVVLGLSSAAVRAPAGPSGEGAMVVGLIRIPLAAAEAAPARHASPRRRPAAPVPSPVPAPLPSPPSEADTPQRLSDEEAAALARFSPSVAAAGSGTPCDLASAVAFDLAHDPVARAALDRLSPETRSVADAVMLWDGQWPADTRAGGKALLRALLVREVAAAPPACASDAQHGPRLFLAPGAGTTIAVVVGSGVWSWSDLLR